jgi:hypothetical protein
MPDGVTAPPRVRFATVLGPPTMESKCLRAVVIDVPLPPDVTDFGTLREVGVILFSESLGMHEPVGFGGVCCDATLGPRSIEDYTTANEHAARFKALGVGVVACRECH